MSNIADANIVNVARERANEVSSDVKSITQLYNEYAVPFELWEVYMTEVRRLALPQSQMEVVYRGFKELEESLRSPYSFDGF